MADLHYWIRSAAHVVFNMKHPWMIEWVDDDTARLRNAQIHVPNLVTYVHDKISALDYFVKEEILFGINLAELGISFEFRQANDSGDETTWGYSPIGSVNADGTLDNPESGKLFNAMVEKHALGLNVMQSREIIMDRAKAIQWNSNIYKAWSLFYPAVHVGALLPGRSTEESLYQYTNSGTSRRHLYYKDGTIGFASNYHKGHLNTGIYKYVLRLLPHNLAVVLYILLRVVRPIEFMTLTEYCLKPEKIDTALNVYQTYVFASWGEVWTGESMSAALMAFFREGFNCNIGVRIYRHFAIALGQKYLTYDKESNSMEQARALAAGHAETMEQTNYAGIKGATGNLTTDEHYFTRISRDWHKLFGLRTHPV